MELAHAQRKMIDLSSGWQNYQSLQVCQPSRSLPLGELLAFVRGNGLRLISTLEARSDPILRLAPKLAALLSASIDEPDEHIYATLS